MGGVAQTGTIVPMRVFLYGGTQVAALACAERLLARGHEVSTLLETAGEGEAYRAMGVDVSLGSPLKLPAIEEGLVKRDVALFFGTDTPPTLMPSSEEMRPYDRVRTDGMRTFVAAALRQRTPLVVLVSSVVVYGDCGTRIVAEDQPLRPPPPAASFADMEKIFGEAVEFQGLNGLVLRSGLVYSARSWHTRTLFHALKTGSCPPVGGEHAYVSPIHAEDLAEAAVAAAEKASPGQTMNITDDAPLRLCDLVRHAAHAAGVKPPAALPSFLLRVVLGKDPYKMLQVSCRASNARAKELLAWQPRYPSLAERLAEEYTLWERAQAPGSSQGSA